MNKKTNLKRNLLAVSMVAALTMSSASIAEQAKTADFWWPNKLNLNPLRQHSTESNPMGEAFNYAKAFKTLDLDAVKKDIKEVFGIQNFWFRWWP